MALEIIDAENHGEFTQKIKELMEFLLTTDKNIFKQQKVVTLRSMVNIKDNVGKSKKIEDEKSLYFSDIK